MGELVEVERFPLVGDAGLLVYEEIGSGRMWTPSRLRDGIRNFGKLKPYAGTRPSKKELT